MINLLICLTLFGTFSSINVKSSAYYLNEDEGSHTITAVTGKRAILFCPIKTASEIKWEKAGERLPIDHRQQIHLNGTLIIGNVRKNVDESTYICSTNDIKGNIKRRHLTLRVIDGPRILPFEFASDLQLGMKIRVMCSVSQGDQPLKFVWIKDGFQINTDSGFKIQNYKDYSMLTVDNVQLSQAGNISCSVSNEASHATYSSILRVNAPPVWTIEPKDSDVILGNSIRIDCLASGSPTPYITWKRATGSEPWDFVPIYNSLHYSLHSNGSLEIQETTRQESGYYVCQSTNGYGSDIGKLIQLTVNEPPRFHVKTKSESIKMGERVQLECTTVGDSPTQITWRVKDETNPVIKAQKGRYIIEKSENRDLKELTSKLIIENVQRNDTNIYSCHAVNKYGNDAAQINLVVQEPPETPREVKFLNVTESAIRLTWKEPYRGNSVITNYLIHYKLDYAENSSTMQLLVNGSEKSATINNLKANSHYLIRMEAQNKIGSSQFNDWIKVKTEESAPEGPPLDVSAAPTGPNSVKISWKVPTKNLWNGVINGFYIGYRAVNSNQDLYKTIEAVDETDRYESHLTNLLRSTVYFAWVQAFNAKGAGPRSDQVSVKTLADVPPSAPLLKPLSTTINSITISWSLMTNFGNSINQFTLYYRTYSSQFNSVIWKEIPITSSEMKFTVTNLDCGKSYEFYMTAHNSVGKSEPSATIIVRTNGDPPLSPKLFNTLSNIGSHEVTVNLMAWKAGQCPISHFSIKNRPKTSRNWNVITSHYSSTQNYVIKNLLPNTHYELETIAHSPAGSTQSLFEFTTSNTTKKETVFKVGSGHKASSYPMQANEFSFSDYEIMLPIVSSTIVVLVIIVVSCCICSRDSSFLFNNNRNRQPVSVDNNKVPFQVVSMKELSTSRVIEGSNECSTMSVYGHTGHSTDICNNSSPVRNTVSIHGQQHHYALPYDILPVPVNTDQNTNTLNRKNFRDKPANIYAPSKNVLQINLSGQRSNYEALVPIQNEIM